MPKNWLTEAKTEMALAAHHLTMAALALQNWPDKFAKTVDEIKQNIGDLQITVELLKQYGKERMDIKQEQAAFRRDAQVSSNCLKCKGVTECMAGGKLFPGCILGRKPGSCSGPYTDWATFEREAEKDE